MAHKAYLFLASGFEEIEAITPMDVLRRAGFDLQIVSINQEKAVEGAHGIIVTADKLISEINTLDADLLVLPGGMPGTNNLMQNKTLAEMLEAAAKQNKVIAAICAAPRILGQLGLLNGHKATCYPGTEPLLIGATVEKLAVVESGNYITANGAGAAMEFSLCIVARFFGKTVANELANKMMVQ